MSHWWFRMLPVLTLSAVIGGAPAIVALQTAQAAAQAGERGHAGGLAATSVAGKLSGVSATSASNAWAAGYYCTTSDCSITHTRILRWNGTRWSTVASPNTGMAANQLFAVSATSASNAWAVGRYCTTSTCSVERTLILRWNGTSWSKQASPNPSPSINNLFGVSATSASNAWAAGYYCATVDSCRTLILRWNGTSWSKVASPNAGTKSNYLFGVKATSGSNAWAAGHYYPASGASRTLILRWNGTSWSKVTSPTAGAGGNLLAAVSATSASNAWAAGDYSASGGTRTLILHWNGTAWSKQASPNPTTGNNELRGISATSASNAWAAGSYCTTPPYGPCRTLILHWNGTGWSKQASPNPGIYDELAAVTATSGSSAWAVGGYYTSSGTEQVLILRWNGTSWSTS